MTDQILPDSVVRELRDRTHTDHLDMILSQPRPTLDDLAAEVASAERFEEWAKRHYRSCPPAERMLAQAQMTAAVRATEARRRAFDEAREDAAWDDDAGYERDHGR